MSLIGIYGVTVTGANASQSERLGGEVMLDLAVLEATADA